MTTVCLIRHGETDWNAKHRIQGREDIPLNEKGRDQARRCGQHLLRNGRSWDRMMSSPLIRARETADIIRDILSLDHVTVSDTFIERDYGMASGLTKEEADSKFPNRSTPGVEPLEDVQKRALEGLERIAEQFNGQNIIIVSHGGLINAVLHALSDGKIGSGITTLQNGCFSTLKFDQRWTIREYNCTPHLYE